MKAIRWSSPFSVPKRKKTSSQPEAFLNIEFHGPPGVVVCKLFSFGRTIKNCLLVLDDFLRGRQIFGTLLSSIDFIWSVTLPPPM